MAAHSWCHGSERYPDDAWDRRTTADPKDTKAPRRGPAIRVSPPPDAVAPSPVAATEAREPPAEPAHEPIEPIASEDIQSVDSVSMAPVEDASDASIKLARDARMKKPCRLELHLAAKGGEALVRRTAPDIDCTPRRRRRAWAGSCLRPAILLVLASPGSTPPGTASGRTVSFLRPRRATADRARDRPPR
jgi:hypothetical protein